MRTKNLLQSSLWTITQIQIAFWLLTLQFLPAQTADQVAQLPQEIDQYLTQKNTPSKPLASLGQDFVSLGSQYGVDPRLVVAISGAESSFGAHVCTQSNAWNWFWEGPCPKSPFDSWESGIQTVTHFMHKSYLLKGYNTIPLIGAKFCAVGCEHWVPNVTQFFSDLGGDSSNLAWSIGPDTSVPVVSPPTPALPTIVATLTSQPATSAHWWQKTAAVTVGVQATVHGALPVAQTVKLVRVSPQGPQSVATLHEDGSDEDGNTVFSGSATLSQLPPGALDLEVTASFPKVASPQASVTSNVLSLTVIPSSSGLPLIIVLSASALALLIVTAVLVAHRKKTKPPATLLKQAA